MIRRETRTETPQEAAEREGWVRDGYEGQVCWGVPPRAIDGIGYWGPLATLSGGYELPKPGWETRTEGYWYLPKTSDTPPSRAVPQEYEIENIEESMERKGYVRWDELDYVLADTVIVADSDGDWVTTTRVHRAPTHPLYWYKRTKPPQMPERKRIKGPKIDPKQWYLARHAIDKIFMTRAGSLCLRYPERWDAIWEITPDGEPGRRIK